MIAAHQHPRHNTGTPTRRCGSRPNGSSAIGRGASPLAPLGQTSLRCKSVPVLLRLLFTGLALLLGLAPPVLAAKEAPSVMIIFDGSGSMWGQLAGERESKLKQARDALDDALRASQADGLQGANVGLFSYGNRRRRDCRDASALRNLAPLNVRQIMRPLRKLNPKGRGPLTRALRKSADQLADIEGPASMILLHDGVDNCRADPCQFAAEFAAIRPHAPIHVISIGLNTPDFRAMSCISDETGGRHFNVQSRLDMQEAVDAAWRLALNKVPNGLAENRRRDARANAGRGENAAQGGDASVVPRPAQPVSFTGSGLALSYSLSANSPPLSAPAQWTVNRQGAAEGDPPLVSVTSPTLETPLQPGSYVVSLSQAGLSARQTIAVTADAVARANLSLDAGMLRVAMAPTNASPPNRNIIVSLFNAAADGSRQASAPVLIRRYPFPQLTLPAGSYLLAARHGNETLTRKVNIVPGASASIDLSFKTGVLELSALTAQNSNPLGDVLFIVSEDDPEAKDGRREIARAVGPRATFVLPSGTYTVAAQNGTAFKTARLALNAGSVVKQNIQIDPASLQLSAQLGDVKLDKAIPVRYQLVSLDQNGPAPLLTQRPNPKLSLAAGRYRIESRVGLANALLAYEVTVTAGQRGKLAMKHQAGQVTFRLQGPSGLTIREGVLWHIVDKSGRVIKQTIQPIAKDVLAAGTYIATARWRGKKYERPFDVGVGDDITVELNIN